MSNLSQKNELEITAIKNYLVNFLNLKKRFPLLPGARTLQGEAGFIGISPDELMEARIRLDQMAKTAALELLKDPEIVDALEKLPFKENQKIAVLGDSITDDLAGWFEIFIHVLDIGFDGDKFRFVNAAVFGDSTHDAMRRAQRDVISGKPEWVIVALGSMDALRLFAATDRTLVSLADFWENLASIEYMVKSVTRNPVIWVTPPPVIEDQMKEFMLFEGSLSERDLREFREVIAGKSGYIVDPLGQRMGNPAETWNFQADGFHPSMAGSIQTVKSVMKALTSEPAD